MTKHSTDIIAFIENSKEVMENTTKRLNNIKVRTKNLKVFLQGDNEDSDNTDVLIEKSKESREKNTIRLDNIKVRMKIFKMFLQEYVENIDKPIGIKKEVTVNIKKTLDNIKKYYYSNKKV